MYTKNSCAHNKSKKKVSKADKVNGNKIFGSTNKRNNQSKVRYSGFWIFKNQIRNNQITTWNRIKNIFLKFCLAQMRKQIFIFKFLKKNNRIKIKKSENNQMSLFFFILKLLSKNWPLNIKLVIKNQLINSFYYY